MPDDESPILELIPPAYNGDLTLQIRLPDGTQSEELRWLHRDEDGTWHFFWPPGSDHEIDFDALVRLSGMMAGDLMRLQPVSSGWLGELRDRMMRAFGR